MKKEFEDNSRQTEVIDRPAKFYTGIDAIEWYTSYNCFYNTVNKDLHLLNVDNIFMLARFIVDFYRQLSLLQSMLSMAPDFFIVYRGTSLPEKELNKIKEEDIVVSDDRRKESSLAQLSCTYEIIVGICVLV